MRKKAAFRLCQNRGCNMSIHYQESIGAPVASYTKAHSLQRLSSQTSSKKKSRGPVSRLAYSDYTRRILTLQMRELERRTIAGVRPTAYPVNGINKPPRISVQTAKSVVLGRRRQMRRNPTLAFVSDLRSRPAIPRFATIRESRTAG